MKKIYLIGFMGSGKSTIGKLLAEETNMSFIDTDQFIEDIYERKISDIFAQEGEQVFRKYEIEALKKLTSYDIIATGGGIIEKKENMVTMKAKGIIIYLHTSFEEISLRLNDDLNRPLWKNNIEDKIALYERRIPIYNHFSDYIIKTDNKKIESIVEEIKEIVKDV